RIWMGVDNTVTTYERGRFSGITGLDGKPLSQAGYARAFAEDRSGTIWLLTFVEPTKHVHLLRMKNRRVEAGTSGDDVIPGAHYMTADKAGILGMGSPDGDLARVRNGQTEMVVRLASSGEPLTGYSLSHDVDDTVWFATSRGLYRWKEGR